MSRKPANTSPLKQRKTLTDETGATETDSIWVRSFVVYYGYWSGMKCFTSRIASPNFKVAVKA